MLKQYVICRQKTTFGLWKEVVLGDDLRDYHSVPAYIIKGKQTMQDMKRRGPKVSSETTQLIGGGNGEWVMGTCTFQVDSR